MPQSVSLSEKDYLAILDVIAKFNQCKTCVDIKHIFRSHLLPLMGGTSGFFAWTTPDIASPMIVDTVNISNSDQKILQELIQQDPMAKYMVEHGRPTMAYDVDIPRENITRNNDIFFDNHPQYKLDDHPYFERLKTALISLDLPEVSLGVAIHRLSPEDVSFTHRDVRIFELLQPHLMHAIKTIVLREELTKHKSLANKLAELPSPLALVAHDFRLIFLNSALTDLFQKKPGERLPEEIAHLMQREISRYEAPYDIEDSKIEIPFVNLPQGIFRLSFSSVNGDESLEEKMWLLRMKSAVEPYSKMNIMMQEAGLTGREIEICILIRDGFENQVIAARLFISLHTVKNHVRNIYKKMNIHTRAQLVALLNKQAEELE
jgi:DNA-binding CsgD family transcriptional regulator